MYTEPLGGHDDLFVPSTALEVYYDLHHNRYLVTGLDNGYENYKFGGGVEGKTMLFSPNALKYYVRQETDKRFARRLTKAH